jgi:putative mRNA 3-end processing factor
MKPTDLLQLRPEGLFCPPAGVFIDPGRVVARAIITHGHGDHCRPGSKAVLTTPQTAAIAAARLGPRAFGQVQTLAYGVPLQVADAVITLVPAGHVLGSAQVVIEAGGARAVVSGDYKRRADPSCAAFEVAPCDLFVTEATFGLPIFRHPPVAQEIGKLLASVAANPDRCHAIGAYALGKTQRMIAQLRLAGWDRTIWLHGALMGLCEVYESFGVPLGPLALAEGGVAAGEIALAPPSALTNVWGRGLVDPVICAASGWMRVRKRAVQSAVELPMVISDHADWDELCATVLDTGAGTVWVTHGAEDALCHWCAGRGIDARPLSIAGLAEGGE